MNISVLFAIRFLKGQHSHLLSFSNWLSLLGIIIGVFSLLVVISVMNGFDADMQKRVIGTKADIRLYHNDYQPFQYSTEQEKEILQLPEVEAVSPVCETELMIQHKKNMTAVICHGIHLKEHGNTTKIFQNMVVGAPDQKALEEDGIIIGLDLSLSLRATVGEYIQITSPIGTEPSPFGLLPKSKKLKVVGIFASGMPEYDNAYTYLSIENVQYFTNLNNEIHYWEIKTNNPEKAYQTAKRIQNKFGDNFIAEDWSQYEANLFQAIQLEKYVMFLVLALMVIIASFNMAGNLIKLVVEKRNEIGILKAIGAPSSALIHSFIHAGLYIGSIGILVGTILAFSLLKAQTTFQFISIPIPGFPLQWLPVKMELIDFLIIPLLTLFICLITTIYPAYKTLQVEPIQMLHEKV